jgi:hypothetical protein
MPAIGVELDAALGVKGVVEANFGGAIIACVDNLSAIAGARFELSLYTLIANAFGNRRKELANFALSALASIDT